MDRQYIENERIVERYLSGDLTVREAREFQRFCSVHPELLDEWVVPPALKTQLARPDMEQDQLEMEVAAGTQAVYSDSRPSSGAPTPTIKRNQWRQPGRWLPVLAVALLISLAAMLGLALRVRTINSQLQMLTHQPQSNRLQAYSSVHTYRVKLVRGRPQRPTLSLGWPMPPELLDMYIDVTDGNYDSFQVTIDRLDGSRVLQIKRIARDSNHELRFALNSSAFGPGEYLMKFDGYTWRGQSHELGWIMLGLQ